MKATLTLAFKFGLVLILLVSVQKINAQCNNGSSYGGGAAPTGGGSLTISTCNWAGEYAPITGVAAATNYQVTSSVGTDFITVRQGTSGGTVIASGVQPLNWTSTVAGNYFIHFNTNAACGTQNSCRNTVLTHIVPSVPMTYSSSNVTQSNTSDITMCSTGDKEIIGVQVTMSGSLTPLNITQLRLRTNGSTNPLADVSNIDVYYTAASSTFATTTLFGSAAPAAIGTNILVNGTQALIDGTNYFWVVYDLNAGATIGNNLDALCNRVTVGGSNYTPTTTAPAGNRTLAVCPPSPGGVDDNILFWLKSDAGLTTTGVNVTGWADQSSTSTAITVNGSPDYVAVGRNYNPYVDFTLSNGTDGGDFLTTADVNVQSFFLIAELTDLTRRSTHMVTYDGVTLAAPCAQCALHGGENAGLDADYGEFAYGNGNFQSAGVWRTNGDGTGVNYNTSHSGNFDIVSALGNGTGSANAFLGGQNSNLPAFNGRPRDWYGPVGEMVVYSGPITTTQANQIESYLAIKYGLTLGGNGSTTIGYKSSSSANIWSANSGYHNDVIGIGRDDNQELYQKQSHNLDDSTRFYISTLAASNASNGGSFSSDASYIMTGHNTGKMCATAASALEKPASMFSRLEREWKVVNTGFSDDFNWDVELNGCAAPGSVTTSDLRLLVDLDGDFSNATVYAAGGGLSFSYAGGVISVTGISTTHIPANSTRFITIASINQATPLPIVLNSFEANCSDQVVDVKWSTTSETNNHAFTILKSKNGYDYEQVAKIDGAGTTVASHSYEWVDLFPHAGTAYYKLIQTDFDGTEKDVATVATNCSELGEISVYPNPARDLLFVEFQSGTQDVMEIEILSAAGQLMKRENYSNLVEGVSRHEISLEGIAPGMYLVSFNLNGRKEVKRISITN